VEEPNQTISFESPPMPESGTIVIYLINYYADIIAHYSQLNVSIAPFINGAYQIYKGRFDQVSRSDEGYLAKIEDEVFISDAERELFKGALFSLVDGEYLLTKRWYESNKTALGLPGSLSEVKPFGKHQVFAVWNQYRLANTIFQFTMQGFGPEIPALVHKIITTDIHDMSINREFLIITTEKDLMLCEISGVLDQVYHTTLGKDFDSTHEFKYIS
jgi:hypothetical protein